MEIVCVCVGHAGEHPRSGAMDVCPFIPVQNVSMDECVNCANIFGRRLAEMLHIPGETAKLDESDEKRPTEGLIWCICSLSLWRGSTKRVQEKPPFVASWGIRSIAREG